MTDARGLNHQDVTILKILVPNIFSYFLYLWMPPAIFSTIPVPFVYLRSTFSVSFVLCGSFMSVLCRDYVSSWDLPSFHPACYMSVKVSFRRSFRFRNLMVKRKKISLFGRNDIDVYSAIVQKARRLRVGKTNMGAIFSGFIRIKS